MKSQAMKMCGLIGSTREFLDYYVSRVQERVQALIGEDVTTLTWYYDTDYVQQHQRSFMPRQVADVAESFANAGATCIAITDDWMREMLNDAAQTIGENRVIYLGDALIAACAEHKCKRLVLLGASELAGKSVVYERLRSSGHELLLPDSETQEVLDHILQIELTANELVMLDGEWFQKIISSIIVDSHPIDAVVFAHPRLSEVERAFRENLAANRNSYRQLNGNQDFICINAIDAHICAIAKACATKSAAEISFN